ncbi:MAG: FAD-dependent oxidoreductase [Opitutaceae bacterium]|nr:FAD-dependent oxidoreductase [Opitutaceae bacterium]
MHRARCILSVWLALGALAVRADDFDIVVVGGTPGGVAAAVSAARHGRSVALVEYHAHLGGMAASGLGKSDIETKEAIGGLWREFVDRVRDHYVRTYGPTHENVKLCRDGYYYEPSVAEKIFDTLVTEHPRIRVFRRHQLDSAARDGTRVVSARIVDRATGAARELRGGVFIDATYEGDLLAAAGAAYRVGREARADFNELHAGVVYQDYETRTFLPGTTGEGDRRIPAYTYRLCLTKDPANSVPLTAPPPGYDRSRFTGYLDDWRAGRFAPPKVMKDGIGYYAPTFGTVVRALSMADLPNGKLDVNMNPRPLGFPFTEENYAYPEAAWPEREKISERLRQLTLGLLWFLQNDPEIPAEHRALARQFNLPRDEFTDNGNFPWQLYVREARRLIGEYTLSENDLIVGPALGRTRVHADSIAAGEYPIDSFPVRKREPGHDVALEGYILMLEKYTQPYHIPYRIMVPRDVDGLLVPVAASTTHIAFSSIRLEPTWMALGQAAATAAHLALRDRVAPRRVNVDTLQQELLRAGQVITFFKDIDRAAPDYAALQFLGTQGFFPDYLARARDPLSAETARDWLARPVAARLAPAVLARLDRAARDGVTRGEFCRLLHAELLRP